MHPARTALQAPGERRSELMPLIPWWLLAKALRVGRSNRDYDWSLVGMTPSPIGRSAIVIGWGFWVLVPGWLFWLLAYGKPW